MLFKTHLVIAILIALLFFNFVDYKFSFMVILLIGTIIPDLDTKNSKLGKFFLLRIFQIFTKHRGITHSIFFGTLLALIISIFYPSLSFGFFIGFVIHIFLDSFTKDGIMAFWPLKIKTRGFIVTGGKIEETIFLITLMLDLILGCFYFAKLFNNLQAFFLTIFSYSIY